MANRYWVWTGVNRQWGQANEGTWSATSGGTGNASVPTAADDVFFDANSGPSNQSVSLWQAICRNLDTTGYQGVFTNPGGNPIFIHGSLTLTKNIPNGGQNIRFVGQGQTYFINAGTNLQSMSVQIGDGNASTYELSGDLTCVTFLLKSASTFNGGGFAMTASSSWSSETNSYLNLSTSTITTLNFANNSDPSLSSLTSSTINCSIAFSSQPNMAYGQLNITPGIASFTWGSDTSYTGVTLDFSAQAACQFTVNLNKTISGTFTVIGQDSYPRIVHSSGATITAGNTVLSKVIFNNITGAGAAAWTGTHIGDMGGNTGITFSTPETLICSVSGAFYNPSIWTGGSGRVPLPQDDAIIRTDATTISITNAAPANLVQVGSLRLDNISGGARTISLPNNGVVRLLTGGYYVGNVTIGTTGRPSIVFAPKGAMTANIHSEVPSANVASAMSTLAGSSIDAVYTFTSGFTISGIYTFSGGGTINFGNTANTITGQAVVSTGTTPRGMSLGDATLALSSTTFFNVTATGLTFNAGTSTLNCTNGVGAVTFNGASLTYNNLLITGACPVFNINGSNTFKSFAVVGNTALKTLTFATGSTSTFEQFSATGVSGGAIIINSSTSTPCNFVKTGSGIVTCNYVEVQNVSATPNTLTWYAGANSVLTNSPGWILSNAPGQGVQINSLFFGAMF